MPLNDDLQTLLKELTDLDTALYDAYWAASTAEGKDQIRGAEDLVDEVIAILDKADLESDNPEITGLAKALNDVTKDLCDLQKQNRQDCSQRASGDEGGGRDHAGLENSRERSPACSEFTAAPASHPARRRRSPARPSPRCCRGRSRNRRRARRRRFPIRSSKRSYSRPGSRPPAQCASRGAGGRRSVRSVMIRPIRNDPVMLTIIVPNGKRA